MTRSRCLILFAGCFALAGPRPTFASDGTTGPVIREPSGRIKAPFDLAIRNRVWDGNPHARPSGRAVLLDGPKVVWELDYVTTATSSADGGTVALLTRDFEVFVSKLPDAPRRIDGGPYLSPALSSDGTLLVAQRLGRGDHILEKTMNTQGIALVNLRTGENRLVLEGNDLYSPSFASDKMIFFGSGGEDQWASLHVLDLKNNGVARVTNREKGARQKFPSEPPQLAGGTVVYESDGAPYRVPAPAPKDFRPVQRFEAPNVDGDAAPSEPGPDFGSVKIRRPTTQSNNPQIFFYFDVDTRAGYIQDWGCQKLTYDGHRGTDFNQSLGQNVVAPAAGYVILRHDGCSNSNSWGCGLGWGNYVALRHTDRSMSLEAHGKAGTVVPFGWYACGNKLMESASSGDSSGYHVHHESWVSWEAWSNWSLRYDPYQGSCDSGDPTKWSNQNGYGSLPGTTCTN